MEIALFIRCFVPTFLFYGFQIDGIDGVVKSLIYGVVLIFCPFDILYV